MKSILWIDGRIKDWAVILSELSFYEF